MHRLKNKPFANCYWVMPGRLLAGEYPLNRNGQESAGRLQDLLATGVTTFINLTVADEMPDYSADLPPRFADKAVHVERLSIADHGVPEKLEYMNLILDRIDAALQAGSMVYVHCRAGIGRTGTVVGCYLARHGHAGREALDELNRLWQDSGRAARWPVVPETRHQASFIEKYAAACEVPPSVLPASSPTTLTAETAWADRYQGALLGMAMAEALVSAGQSEREQSMPGTLAGLSWQSNTAMTWALADSLLYVKGMDAQDQMQRYLRFAKRQQYCLPDQVIAVPEWVTRSLGVWQLRRIAMAGSHDPDVLDAHSLARTTAVALYYARHPERALREAVQASRTTLQAPLVIDSCRVVAALLVEILAGKTLAQLVPMQEGATFTALRAESLKPEMLRLMEGQWRQALNEPAGNDCLSILASALHAVFTGTDFVSSMQRALAQPGHPLHVAALTGALAGALYGASGLPLVWRETLAGVKPLCALAEDLLAGRQENP